MKELLIYNLLPRNFPGLFLLKTHLSGRLTFCYAAIVTLFRFIAEINNFGIIIERKQATIKTGIHV